VFDALPDPPRRYVPAGVDPLALPALSACYDELAARPLPDADLWALEQWLRDWSELEALVAEATTRREIAMTCRTDDPAAEAAFLDVVDRVAPHCKPRRDRLARRLVAHPAAARLDPARHAALLRRLAGQVALYRDELVPLEAAEQRLCADYQKLRAAQTAAWDGEARTLEAIDAAEDDPDRARREAAWRTVSARFLADKPAFDDLFDRLLAVRRAQAAAAGFRDFRDYRFRKLERSDYGPDDCLAFHAAIEAAVVPLAAAQLERRRAALGLASVRPWDLVAPLAGPALRPFAPDDPAALVRGATAVFAAVDPGFARQFESLAARGLLDLMSRPGKAPGAYQAALEASGVPFVFANAVGRHDDVLTVLHEGGHAFHALACADDPLIWNRSPPIEFCEVASTAMELMGGRHLDPFYPPDAARRAQHLQLEQIVLFLPYMACVDAFQHWLYTHPDTDARARDAAWLALHRRFFPTVDWSDLDDERAALWQRKLHIFELPFYYIEYGIAHLGALQQLAAYLRDPAAAVAAYRRALALGARAGLRELFAAADLRFDLSAASVRAVMDLVGAELARLAD
jgi:oligoendopeptidase F